MADMDVVWKKVSQICDKLSEAASVRIPRGDIRAFRVGRSNTKLFVFLAPTEKDRGLHLRSVDPAVLGDARFEESRVFLSAGRTNWVRLKWTPDEPDWEKLTRLLVESHRLTMGKNQGIPPRSAFGDVYPILGKALAIAGPNERPAPPYHADGPMPKLPATSALAVALWSAEQVRSFAPVEHLADIDAALALVRDLLADPPANVATAYQVGRFRKLYERLRTASATRPKDSRALGAAKRAAGAGASLSRGKPDMVWEGAALAAERAVQALQDAAGPQRVRAYLEALDDRILREEIGALDGSEKVDRVLWRGANEKGMPALWLVRFEGGGHGLRRKLGARYAWLKGSKDDVLASVPDIDFDRAVKTALVRDATARSPA
jgi:hypothetical protein